MVRARQQQYSVRFRQKPYLVYAKKKKKKIERNLFSKVEAKKDYLIRLRQKKGVGQV